MAKKSAKPAAPSKKTRVDVIPGAESKSNEKAPVESKHEETRNVPGEDVKLPVRRVAEKDPQGRANTTPADADNSHTHPPEDGESKEGEDKVENVAQTEKE